MTVEIYVIRWQDAPWNKEVQDNAVFLVFGSIDEVEAHCLKVAQSGDVCEINARAEGRLLVNLHKSKKQRGLVQTLINKFPK